MKILTIGILVFFISCITDAKDNSVSIELSRTDTLYGYFNNDSLRDFMIKRISPDEIYFEIYLKKQNEYEKAIFHSFSSSLFSDEDFFQNADLYNDSRGSVSIVGFCCGNWKTVESFYYKYNDKVKNWILEKKYTYSYNEDYSINYEVIFPTETLSINALKFEELSVQNTDERRTYYSNLLSDLLVKYSKNKNYSYLSNYPKFIILDMIKMDPITINNVAQYNDLAYYLQQTNFEDVYAQYILEEVVRQFPKRMVAYINLGDAYWDLKNYEYARKNYNIYIKLMKEAGKDSKIPQTVLNRLEE